MLIESLVITARIQRVALSLSLRVREGGQEGNTGVDSVALCQLCYIFALIYNSVNKNYCLLFQVKKLRLRRFK